MIYGQVRTLPNLADGSSDPASPLPFYFLWACPTSYLWHSTSLFDEVIRRFYSGANEADRWNYVIFACYSRTNPTSMEMAELHCILDRGFVKYCQYFATIELQDEYSI